MAAAAQAQLHEALTGLDDVTKQLDKAQTEIDRLLQHQQWLVERKKELEMTASRLQAECQRERPDVTKSDFPWSKKLHSFKKSVFGMDEFRPLQEQTINATMSGQDCILVMPTGGGKSLCYQLPAVISKGFTLVVSPLVALMEDQTMGLEQLSIKAALLNAGLPQDRVKLVHQAMIDPKSELKLIYVTPEKIAKSKRFMAQLEKAYKKGLLARIAIDEVHCCSQWGHDFRPDYKILGLLKRQFSETPVLGLTATATNSVLEDVKKILNIQGCMVYRASYNRANLYYEVLPKPSKHAACIEEMAKLLNGKFKNQSGIIYCFTRRESEQIAAELQSLGIRAQPYHASMETFDRSAVHRKWKSNKTQVVVATTAFGMGIDKPDVRFVIHHSLSKSIENYYQESGRAGRNDKRADCILFFQVSDMFRQSTMVVVEQTGLEKLYNMVAYCISQVKCRRGLLATHFGERWDGKTSCNGMCDNCNANAEVCRKDIQSECRAVYDILSQGVNKDQRMTANKVADVLQGKTVGGIQLGKENKTKSAKRSRTLVEQMLAHLILEGYLKEDFHFTPYSTISYLISGPKSSRLKSSQDHPIILKTADPKKKQDSNSPRMGHNSNRVKGATTSSKKVKQVEGLGKSQINGENSAVVVIDLSDESGDEVKESGDFSRKKLKKPRVRMIESDSDEDVCMVVDDGNNSNLVTPSNKSSSSQFKDKSASSDVCEKGSEKKFKFQKKTSKSQASCQPAGGARTPVKQSILGKRKEISGKVERSKVSTEGTPAKKHKTNMQADSSRSASVQNDKKQLSKGKVTEESKVKGKDTVETHEHSSRPKVKSDKTNSSAKVSAKSEHSHDKLKGKQSTDSTKDKTNTDIRQKIGMSESFTVEPEINGDSFKDSSFNESDELDDLQSVYSEQLASLERKTSRLSDDSEDDFQ